MSKLFDVMGKALLDELSSMLTGFVTSGKQHGDFLFASLHDETLPKGVYS